MAGAGAGGAAAERGKGWVGGTALAAISSAMQIGQAHSSDGMRASGGRRQRRWKTRGQKSHSSSWPGFLHTWHLLRWAPDGT